jgi:hypothetical protein
MSFLPGASHTHISGGFLAAVQGDQVNNTVYGTLIHHSSSATTEKRWTIQDEVSSSSRRLSGTDSYFLTQYIQVPTGRVKLLKKISETPARKWLEDHYDPGDKRIIHVASISNEHPEFRFIRISYSGRNAKKVGFSLPTMSLAR